MRQTRMIDKEKNDELYKIGKKIQLIFPNYHGNIQFNLKPGRKTVMVTKNETLIENRNTS